MNLAFEKYNEINEKENLKINERILKPLALEKDKIFAYIAEDVYTGELSFRSSQNYEKYIQDPKLREKIRKILIDFQFLLTANEIKINYNNSENNIFEWNDGEEKPIKNNAFGELIKYIDNYTEYGENFIKKFKLTLNRDSTTCKFLYGLYARTMMKENNNKQNLVTDNLYQ